jgi:PQQ-dependent catabolism-associated beta-propeller protein
MSNAPMNGAFHRHSRGSGNPEPPAPKRFPHLPCQGQAWYLASDAVMQLRKPRCRRPRESGGPGQVSEIPRFPLSRERRTKTPSRTNPDFLTPASAGVTVVFAAIFICAASPASAETIYVSNEKDNTITVIDGANLVPVKTIPVGQRPRGIVLSKDEKWLYICASDSDHIEVLDLATDKIARTLPSGADPEYFALDPTGKLLYIANEDSNLVTVVDIDRGAVVTEIPVGVEPEGMGISPDGRYLVNTSETTNMAHVIDTATHEIVANILVDSRPRRAVWTADGAQFWVSAEIGGTVSVIDAAKDEVIKRITFAVPGVPSEAIQPVGLAITRDRKLAFAALGPANRVAVIDAQSYEVMRYVLVGQRVWSLAFNPDQSRLYTTNGVSNDITVIDLGSLKAIKSIPVGQSPWGVVSRP